MENKTIGILILGIVLLLSAFVRMPVMAQTAHTAGVPTIDPPNASGTNATSTNATSGDNATASAVANIIADSATDPKKAAESISSMAATDPKMAATVHDSYLDDFIMVNSIINALKAQQGPFNVRLSSALNATVDNASSIGQISASSVIPLKSAFWHIFKDHSLGNIYNKICGPTGIILTNLKTDSEARRWAINACPTVQGATAKLLQGIAGGSHIASTDTNMSRAQLNEQQNATAIGLVAYGLGLKQGASQGANLGIDGTTLGAEAASWGWLKKAVKWGWEHKNDIATAIKVGATVIG